MRDAQDLLELNDALRAIAAMGDLSMGQPIDHSWRVAQLAVVLARQLGWSQAALGQVRQVALLRWSGCTANAEEIAAAISDDVSGRAAMLALQKEQIQFLVPVEALAGQAALSMSIHCEVSSLVAQTLGLQPDAAEALRCVFEQWDGKGGPRQLQGEAIPTTALVVLLCSELEVFTRVHGLPCALGMIRQRAGVMYPVELVDCACAHAAGWMAALDRAFVSGPDEDAVATAPVGIALMGHLIDLKLPWMTGHSAAVVALADAMAVQLGLASAKRLTLRRAAWLHGLGRVAIPNSVWKRAQSLSPGEWERVRLAPYWTSRALRQIKGLAEAGELASFAYERMDGSGHFRGASAASLTPEGRILSAAVAWVDSRTDRPGYEAMSMEHAWAAMQGRSESGPLFEAHVLDALQRCVSTLPALHRCPPAAQVTLTTRELEVLKRISLGDSNKEAAKRLGISPSTVRTHLERVFKKLNCKTRAACTLQASLLGLLVPATS